MAVCSLMPKRKISRQRTINHCRRIDGRPDDSQRILYSRRYDFATRRAIYLANMIDDLFHETQYVKPQFIKSYVLAALKLTHELRQLNMCLQQICKNHDYARVVPARRA